MCRRTFTHHMHHDVRQLMITSLDHENHTVYANPLRTVFHRCEIDVPIPQHWLLNNPYPPCAYHSCCHLSNEVEFCSEFIDELLDAYSSDEELEPEMCPYFVRQHRHRRLEYLGQPESYAQECPATWQEGVEEISEISFPYFEQDQEQLFRYAVQLFRLCEEYYQLEQDAETLFLVYRDLATGLPRGDPRISVVEEQVVNIQARLTQKKQELFSKMVWAKGLSPEKYSKGFIPVWWLRMWALKQQAEEEESEYYSSSGYSS
ncbi:uncharacterized protein F4812DRAFT_465117 [Daldinia caldariorum]|uniref:uncharacterized protein n=1 Tax=Daldinia caldariorum TaxID=326644 RepID=UPI0020081F18|nr:uncharacterized protein F4812DRAFT_465117 [Daldinia caldariorum]KAI1473219.1 hypothetical protein F4812DRAFT_465117 [Daldinia caldariorum]